MSGGRIALWVGVAIALVVIIFVVAKVAGPKNPSSTTTTGGDAPAVTSADWSEGNANAPVTLIEYGDYECPACGTYFPVIEQVRAAYGDRLRFVFRNFPLTQIHEDAQLSAESAEAAGLQGKFWEMNNWLYQNQLKWAVVPLTGQAVINAEAQSMGLNMDKFNSDRASDAVKAKIAADVAGANAAGVDHTPTFFVNLKQIPNPSNLDEFKAVIDAALAGGSASATSSASSTLLNNASGTGPSTKK